MTTKRSELGASIIGEQDNFSAPWPAGFRGHFLRDLAQFIECWGHSPVSYTYPLSLSAEEIQLFTVEVPKYIDNYIKHHTKSPIPHDQGNYAVERYIDELDDPYNQFRDSSRTTDFLTSGGVFGSVIPGQLQRDAPSGWPAGEYTGRTAVATTSQTFQNHNFEETFQSTGTTFTRGSDVRDLPCGQPSSRKSASHSHSRTGTENVDYRAGGSSSGCKGNMGKQVRRGYSHAEPSKRAASTTSRRPSEASKFSRREAKSHVCSICSERYPFEARLRSHMAVHNHVKILCPDCGAGFGRESSLKRHINTPGACEKKKQAKKRPSSGGSSRHGSNGDPIDNNPPDYQNNSGIQPGGNNMARNQIPTSPRISQSMYLTQTHLERGVEQHYAQSYPGTSQNQSPQPQSNWEIDHVTEYLWPFGHRSGGD